MQNFKLGLEEQPLLPSLCPTKTYHYPPAGLTTHITMIRKQNKKQLITFLHALNSWTRIGFSSLVVMWIPTSKTQTYAAN